MQLATRLTAASAPFIVWEECACLACGSERHTPILEGVDAGTNLRFLVVLCNDCGLAFTNPRPDTVSLQRFYPAQYRCHQPKLPSAKIDPLTRFLPVNGLARLLDFGCGAGDFLVQMQALGWNVVGLDASPAAIKVVRARGFSAHVGTLPCPDLADARFDAITMRQSLEHTHAPLEVLRCARQLLTPNGRLIVAVPNFDGWTSRWFGAHWYGLDVPRHLAHFTPATLRAILERAGFARMEMHQQTRSSWVRHSAGLAERRGFGSRFLQMRIGSTIAARWGKFIGAADCLIAVADNRNS